MREAREKLESEMEDAYHEHQANMLRQGASFKLLLDPQGFVNEDEGFLDHITKVDLLVIALFCLYLQIC